MRHISDPWQSHPGAILAQTWRETDYAHPAKACPDLIREWIPGGTNMPSLLRILAVVGIIAGIGYGVIFTLAYLVDPKPREISVTVPADRFYKQR